MSFGTEDNQMKKISINRKRLLRLGWPFIILFLLSIIIFRERMGLKLEEVDGGERQAFEDRLFYVGDEEFSEVKPQEIECLILVNSNDVQSNTLRVDIECVLQDMRVGYDVCDLATKSLSGLDQYNKVVVTLSELDVLGDEILTLCDWVEDGGQMMSTGTFANNAYWAIMGNKAGVLNSSSLDYASVSGIRVLNNFMINANGLEFKYDESSDTAHNVSLLSESTVYIEEINTGIPLLWETPYGQGKFVINNQVISGKECRGILCASYSLLGNICAYPVVNGSTFYIDDFPSPVPSGDGEYIARDYGVSISNFYSNIWWPDILKLQEKYGIIYTGLIIEDYSDIVEEPFVRTKDVERFEFFGNMLLNEGGELGFHGYNHMPLCMDNYDYMGLYDSYNKWPSVENMKQAITEVRSFGEKLFPEENFVVYVPPSNIMSDEGREALKNSWPSFKIIASLYLPGDASYEQDYCVAEDGIIETPRVTSGFYITDYMMRVAFSELNFHFVQSHFMHPDDTLDEERGAALGWEELYSRYDNYMNYIYTAAPMIRNVSGTGMGEAVREFDKLSVERIEGNNLLELNLGGFYKEAYLLVRINSGTPVSVQGGEIEAVADNLYLLHAQQDNVIIRYQ